MNISEEQAIESLGHARGPEMRMQPHQLGSLTLINDAYNANPNSMRAALETITALPTTGRRIAVLGDMLELGETSDGYHREIGQAVAKCNFDMLACIGPKAALIAESAEQSGIPRDRIHRFPDAKKRVRIPFPRCSKTMIWCCSKAHDRCTWRRSMQQSKKVGRTIRMR